MRTPEELTKVAWANLDEFMRTGKVTLPAGGGQDGTAPKQVAPDKNDPTCRELLDVSWKLANLQGKPKKVPRAMDDWKPKVTQG